MAFDANKAVERYRRGRLDDRGFPIAPGGPVPTYGWQAFEGALGLQADDAEANGMNFRTDLSGIGTGATMPRRNAGAFGMLDDDERAGVLGNVALSNFVDRNRARLIQDQALKQGGMDDAVAGMQRGYDEQVQASAFAPPIAPHVMTRTIGEGGETFTDRPGAPLSPEDVRAKVLQQVQQLPVNHPARVEIEKRFAAEDLATRKQAEVERAAKASESIMGGAVLSPDAIDENAKLYLQTGTMPTLGMKDPGNRAKILNRAAELANGGASGNVAANKADYKADAGSLTALQKQRDAVGAFEGTALKNLDVFIDAAKKIPDTGSPILNKPLRAISEQGLGDTDLAAFNAARKTVVPEFAKILSNPGLSGQLSDSARHEVEQVISGNATLGQILAVANTLKTDAANRRTSYDDQLKTIRERIGKPGGSGSAAPAKSAEDYRAKYKY